MSNATPELDSLTESQRDEIDSLIIVGERLSAIKSIMDSCGVFITVAKELNRARYRHLRETRGAEFSCDDEEYWSGFFDCIFEAMEWDEGTR